MNFKLNNPDDEDYFTDYDDQPQPDSTEIGITDNISWLIRKNKQLDILKELSVRELKQFLNR